MAEQLGTGTGVGEVAAAAGDRMEGAREARLARIRAGERGGQGSRREAWRAAAFQAAVGETPLKA